MYNFVQFSDDIWGLGHLLVSSARLLGIGLVCIHINFVLFLKLQFF